MTTQSIELRFLEYSRRRKNWNKYGSHIKPGFLSTRATKTIWRSICRRFGKDDSGKLKIISRKDILEFTETHYPKEADKVRSILQRMKSISYADNDTRVVEFIQKGMVEESVNEAINCLTDPDGLKKISQIRDMLDAAVQVSAHADSFYNFFDEADSRKGIVRTNLVPTGISKRLDEEALEGGIASGELGVFIGPTGRGKTEALCNLAAGAMRFRKNVLYCTLQDLSAVRIARIIDQILLGWSKDRITNHPEDFKRAIWKKKKSCGSLIIKDMVQQAVSVYDIRSIVETVEEGHGINIDLLIVDYLDTMVSHTKDNDQNVVFYKIGQALQRLGSSRGFGVWTASQGNRESLDADDVKLAHIAGAIAKTRCADIVIGMAQKDTEKSEGYMRWEFLKTRITDELHKITVFKDKETRRYGERRKIFKNKEDAVQERTEKSRRAGSGKPKSTEKPPRRARTAAGIETEQRRPRDPRVRNRTKAGKRSH